MKKIYNAKMGHFGVNRSERVLNEFKCDRANGTAINLRWVMVSVKLFVYKCINGLLVAMSLRNWLRMSFSLEIHREARPMQGVLRDGIFVKAKLGRLFAGGVWLTYGHDDINGSRYAVVYSLFVHPMFRRLGVGKLLMAHCFVVAKEYGFLELFLACKSYNRVALRLYDQMGFAPANNSAFGVCYQNELGGFQTENMVGLFKPL